MRTLKLATRGSALALTQSRMVAADLCQAWPGLRVELLEIKTTGDLNQRDSLTQIGGKGVFVKEIEQALLAGEADFAVHSLKDMPSQLPPGLTLAAPPRREDPRDALVGAAPLAQVGAGQRIGTGSLRRQVQLRALRPDLEFLDIRGNVPTRVEKWRRGDCPGGVVLACAGLARLGAASSAQAAEIHPLEAEECLPSPCQGILGLQFRSDDREVGERLAALEHSPSHLMARAERAYLAALGGDCNLPAGGLAEFEGESLRFRGVLWRDSQLRRVELRGTPAEAESLGQRAAQELLGAP